MFVLWPQAILKELLCTYVFRTHQESDVSKTDKFKEVISIVHSDI